MVAPRDFARWARGVPKDAVEEDENGDVLEEPAEEGEPGDDGVATAPAIWKGEAEGDGPVDLEEAMALREWLADYEPDLLEPLAAIEAQAIEGAVEDPGEDEEREDFKAKLMSAEQYLVPELPAFTPQQREAYVEAVMGGELGELDAVALMATALKRARLVGEEADADESDDEDNDLPEDFDPEEASATKA